MQLGSSYACGGGDGSTDRLRRPCACCAACCCTLCSSSSRSASCFASSRRVGLAVAHASASWTPTGHCAGSDGHCMRTGGEARPLCRSSIVGRLTLSRCARARGATASRASGVVLLTAQRRERRRGLCAGGRWCVCARCVCGSTVCFCRLQECLARLFVVVFVG